MCDEHKSQTSCDNESWWAGNWGPGLHVSAPGVRVATIDMLGSDGFNASEYYNSFNGTSAACPNAAGVVALMLSNTPSMTEATARGTLAITSEKVGGYDYSNFKEFGFWSLELGYGRINAAQALGNEASGIGYTDKPLNAIIETHPGYHLVRFDDSEPKSWQLLDLSGKSILSGTSNDGMAIIKHNELATGIYTLTVQSNNTFSTVKLVIR
jgi:hypothetical protein